MGPAKKATTMVGRLCSAPFKPWYICSTTELIMAFCLSLFDTLLHLLHIHKILVCCIALPLTLYGQTTMLVLLLFPTWTPATSFWVSIWTSGKSSRFSQIEELWPRFTWLRFNWFFLWLVFARVSYIFSLVHRTSYNKQRIYLARFFNVQLLTGGKEKSKAGEEEENRRLQSQVGQEAPSLVIFVVVQSRSRRIYF